MGAAAGVGHCDDCGLAQPVRGDPRVRTDHVVLSTRRLHLQRRGRDHRHRRPDPRPVLLRGGPVTRSAAANRIILVGTDVGAVAYSAPPGPTVLDLPGVCAGEVERRKSWADGSAVFYAWRTDGRWALTARAGVAVRQRHSGERADMGHLGDRVGDRRSRLESTVAVLGAGRRRGDARDDDAQHECRLLQRGDVRAVPRVRPGRCRAGYAGQAEDKGGAIEGVPPRYLSYCASAR